MKKVIMSLVTMVMLTVGSYAVDGNVGEVTVSSDGTIKVQVSTYTKALVGTPDAIKAMYAAALTAKSQGTTVVGAAGGTHTDGTVGWVRLILR